MYVGDETAADVWGHEGGDFVDVGDHGEPTVGAVVFLEEVDGVEVGLGSGVGFELAEEVAAEFVEFIAAFFAGAEVGAMGGGDFFEGGVVELVFVFEPGHAEGEAGFAGGEVEFLASDPEGAECEEQEG